MPVENPTFIDDLNEAYPLPEDPKSEGDDHLRNFKRAVKDTFPNINGVVAATDEELSILSGLTASTAELNTLDGVTASAAELNILDGATLSTAELNFVKGATSAIQTQINAKAPLASPVFTGTPKAPTAAPGTNTDQIATMAALQAAAFAAALPAGVEGQFLSFQGGIWTPAQAPNQVVRLVKSTNYTLVFADRADLVECSGVMTLSFAACAALGNGWFAWLWNNGTDPITLDPNGAETIDGAATSTLYPGEVRLVQCNGSALRTARLNRGSAGVMHVQDQKPTGTVPGNSVAGFQNRTLNTVVTNTLEGASLAGDLVTLPAGIYRCKSFSSTTASGSPSRHFVYNNTDGAPLIIGSTGSSNQAIVGHGQFTITATKQISLRQYTTTVGALGLAVNDGQPEVYASLYIEKVG